MINRPIDLIGFLHLVWKADFEMHDTDAGNDSNDDAPPPMLTDADFQAAKTALAQTPLSSPDSMGPFLRFLHPRTFASMISTPGGGQVDPRVSNLILPVILTILQLRRSLSSSIDLSGDRGAMVIRATIPHAIWTYVELQMDTGTLREYEYIHRVYEPLLGSSKSKQVDEEELESRFINMAIHRRLCHAVHNPILDKFYTNSKRARACMEKFYYRGGDYGATQFFHTTKPVRTLPCYGDRYSLILYMSSLSPKLRLLGAMAHTICNLNSRKLLIFIDWPTV